jgi:hypothetical protein
MLLYMHRRLTINQMMSANPSPLEKHSPMSYLCWSMKIGISAKVHLTNMSLWRSMVRSMFLYRCSGLIISQMISAHASATLGRSPKFSLCWSTKIQMFANVHSTCISLLCSTVSFIFLYRHSELNISQMMSVHPSALAKRSSNSCLCWRMEIHMFANVHSGCILLLCSTVSSRFLYMCSRLTINQMMSTHASARVRCSSNFFLC